MTESPSAVVSLLGEAADHLDYLALNAVRWPWKVKPLVSNPARKAVVGPEGWYVTSEINGHDAAWIAALSPAVAPILSEWLRSTARLAATYTDRNIGVLDHGAVELARLVLRGTDSDPT